VLGVEKALEARSALRSATLLGVPAAAPAASPDSTGSAGTAPVGGEAERWRAEAQRLQATLDDPHKLEHYFDEKAAREYAQARPESLDLKDVPRKGAAGAPVQVVEYSDFLCPFCRNLAGAFSSFLQQSGNRVEIYYKNYPLETECNPNVTRTAHPGACALARGAICAQAQGKFWAYHDRVFAQPPREGTVPDVAGLALAAGLDPAAFAACSSAPATRDALTAQITEAKRLGVTSTPTLFLNGKKLPRINDFVQLVDKEAQAKGFPPLQAGGAAGH
jgi:protein-disulfide isomerase